MPVTDLLLEGVELMLLGMGSVFVFLTALVLAMKGMSRLANTLTSGEAVAAASAGIVTRADEDDELTAAISAAITRYRSQHK